MFCKTNQLFFCFHVAGRSGFSAGERRFGDRCSLRRFRNVFRRFFTRGSRSGFFGEERARDREIFCSPDSWVDMGADGVEFNGGGRLLTKMGLPKDGLISHYLSPADTAFGRGHI